MAPKRKNNPSGLFPRSNLVCVPIFTKNTLQCTDLRTRLTARLIPNYNIPNAEITEEEISQLTSERAEIIEASKSNSDLMKIHFKVLEDFEKMKKSETMIKTIREMEVIQNENTELKAGFHIK